MIDRTDEPILRVEGLGKSFGAIVAVDSVSFTLGRGQILGIAGPNGSGKSTLFNVMTGLPYRADRGRCFLSGQALDRMTAYQIARLGLVRTFQRENVFASMSAVDNVLLAVENNGQHERFSTRVDKALEALDTVGFPATMHNNLSGGLPVFYRKLVMVAAALALNPKVLLLDEPASSLIPDEIARLQALIEQLRDEGTAIVLIEHVLSLLRSVSDQLLVMDQGRVIAFGDVDSVINEPAVIEAYLGVPHA